MISCRLPRAVAAGNAATVYALAMQAGDDMQAERLAALLCDGLTATQKESIAAPLCATAPAGALAQLGALAFSFPLWRFISQRTQTMDSIIEAAGYQRLSRATDLRDASLPDPARDELGVGFIRQTRDEYIEYRRSYIAYATRMGAMIVRNSSYFYGRDRLKNAVYIAEGEVSPDVLKNMTAAEIESSTIFSPLTHRHGELAAHLVAGFMRHENALHDFAWGEGLGITLDYLRDKLAAKRGMPYIGMIKKGWPAWSPLRAMALDGGVINDIASGAYTGDDNMRIVMLSGAGGDYPL